MRLVLRFLLISLPILGATGCASFVAARTGAKPTVCNRYKSRNPTATADYVMAIGCGNLKRVHLFSGGSKADKTTDQSYDETKPNHLTAAIMVGACALGSGCKLRGSTSLRAQNFAAIASRYHPAKFLDHEEVARQVAALGLDPWVKRRFLSAARTAARSLVNAVENQWTDLHRRVYLTPVSRVRTEWISRRSAQAPLKRRWDKLRNRLDEALIDNSASAALQAQLATLLNMVIKHCAGRGESPAACMSGALARPMLEYDVRTSRAIGDHLAASRSARLLGYTSDHRRLQYALYYAVRTSMRRELIRYRAYEKARRRGASEPVLRRKFGSMAPLRTYPEVDSAGFKPPRRATFSSARNVYSKTLAVHTLRRVGRNAIIGFKSVVMKYEKQLNCRETRRVDRVTRSGRVVYRTRCTGPWVKRKSVQAKASMRVPWSEARFLRRGDVVEFVYSTAKAGTRAPARRAVHAARVVRVHERGTSASPRKRGTLKQLGRYRIRKAVRVGARASRRGR